MALRDEDYVAFLDESGEANLQVVAGVLIPRDGFVGPSAVGATSSVINSAASRARQRSTHKTC